MVDTLEILQWVLISLQGLALIYFNYYAFRFGKQFSLAKQDALAILSLVFVELTLLSKIILRSSSIIAINATDNTGLEIFL
jgi:hypothetical protein